MPLALLEYQVRAHLALALDAEDAAVERDRGVGLFLRVVLGVFGVGDDELIARFADIALGDDLDLVRFAVYGLLADDGDDVVVFH